MGCVVQLRGLNASGKTTAMRQFAENNGLEEIQIDVNGIRTWVMTNADIAVVGRYPKTSNFGGCDSCIKGKQHLLNTIQTLMSGGYKTIAFEGFLFSGSAKLAAEVNDLAKMYGYVYIAVLMNLDYNTELNRLFARNGGKDINLKSFDSGRKGVYNSHLALKKQGIKTMVADVENTAFEEMGEIVKKAVLKCG